MRHCACEFISVDAVVVHISHSGHCVWAVQKTTTTSRSWMTPDGSWPASVSRKGLRTHFGQHPAAEIITSLPGLGPILGARLLGEFGDDP